MTVIGEYPYGQVVTRSARTRRSAPETEPRCVIVTGTKEADGLVKAVHELTLPSKQAYCERWGHDIAIVNHDVWDCSCYRSQEWQRWHGFARMRAVESLISQELLKPESERRAAFVMWIDADAAITNPELSLPALLNWFGPKAHVFATTDYNGLHTGTFAFRVSELSLEILQAVWNSDPKYDTGHWFEQGALADVIAANPVYRRATCILPKRSINGYPRAAGFDPNNKRAEDYWQLGDFILHVPGMPYEARYVILKQALERSRKWLEGDIDGAEADMPTERVQVAVLTAEAAQQGAAGIAAPTVDQIFAEAWAAHQAGDLRAAERGYRYLITQAWDEEKALQFLVSLLCSEGRFADALPLSEHLCAIRTRDATLLAQQAGIRLHLSNGTAAEYQQIEPMLRQAHAINPSCPLANWNLSLLLLRQGQYMEGFRSARWEMAAANKAVRHADAEWDGSRDVKSVYLYATQGIGDTIQWLRFLPMLRRFTDDRIRIVVEVQHELVPLLLAQPGGIRRALGVDRIVGRLHENNGLAEDCEAHMALGSLPHALQIISPDLVPTAPYLTADGVNEGTRGMIGVCWKGSPKHGNDTYRSIHDAERALAPLLQAAEEHGKSVISLNPGEPVPGALSDRQRYTINPVSVLDTARVIAGLDAVVTVDSMVANLAGAMQVCPTIVLSAANGDWRWGMTERNGERNDWYPHVATLRQQRLGDWTPVIERATEILTTHFLGAESAAAAEPKTSEEKSDGDDCT